MWLLQREERKMLRELKVFLDQLERDVLRAQGADGNLTDKYHVSQSRNYLFFSDENVSSGSSIDALQYVLKCWFLFFNLRFLSCASSL